MILCHIGPILDLWCADNQNGQSFFISNHNVENRFLNSFQILHIHYRIGYQKLVDLGLHLPNLSLLVTYERLKMDKIDGFQPITG